MLLGLRFLNRLYDLRHTDGVDLIARLHHLLFQIEEDLGKARLLFRQREDRLIHHLQTERGVDSFTPRIRHAEANARLSSPACKRRSLPPSQS